MIRNIIFDLDGVLFDGVDMHAKLFIESLVTILPDSKLTREYHDFKLNNLSTRKKLRELGIDNETSEKIYKLKQELTLKSLELIKYNEKNEELCKKLICLGFRLFCVTNSSRHTVETVLSKMGIFSYFTGIISNQDVLECKPSPEPYLTCYMKYKINAYESLIVEDSPIGVESAKASGGNVLSVRDCNDVTFENILNEINKINRLSTI